MIYGYARVSTKGQEQKGNSLQDQEEKLRKAGAEKIYKEAFTGTKGDRPELTKLLSELAEGDSLIVTKLDRVARSIKLGAELIDDLMNRGVTVNILNLGVLDNSPSGRLMRNVFLAFAEFERDMIVERTQDGKAVARQRDDYQEGRPKKFRDDEKIEEICEKYHSKKMLREEAIASLGMSARSFQNYYNEWKKSHCS